MYIYIYSYMYTYLLYIHARTITSYIFYPLYVHTHVHVYYILYNYVHVLIIVISYEHVHRIVYSLFNKQPRKFRKRQQIRHRKRICKAAIDMMVDTLLTTYKNFHFTFKLRTCILVCTKINCYNCYN